MYTPALVNDDRAVGQNASIDWTISWQLLMADPRIFSNLLVNPSAQRLRLNP